MSMTWSIQYVDAVPSQTSRASRACVNGIFLLAYPFLGFKTARVPRKPAFAQMQLQHPRLNTKLLISWVRIESGSLLAKMGDQQVRLVTYHFI